MLYLYIFQIEALNKAKGVTKIDAFKENGKSVNHLSTNSGIQIFRIARHLQCWNT